MQFLYALLVGNFPFNAFLAGFFCCIGSFVLTGGCLPRREVSPARALAPAAPGVCPAAARASPDCAGPPLLAVCLRMQVDPQNDNKKSPERAFGDYSLAMCVLFLAVWNYVG